MVNKKRQIKVDNSTYNPVILLNINESEGSFGGMTTLNNPFINSSTFSERSSNYFNVPDNELTSFCMQVSERSLAEVWENEDDDYWESFL